jgi:hypothetical protein
MKKSKIVSTIDQTDSKPAGTGPISGLKSSNQEGTPSKMKENKKRITRSFFTPGMIINVYLHVYVRQMPSPTPSK